MDYKEALDFLRTLDDYQKSGEFDRERKLEPVLNFMKKASVDFSALKTIHVAGSKGKGSVSRLIADYLSAAGYKTGIFSSPYILNPRESFMIGSEMIPEDEFSAYVTVFAKILERNPDLKLSLFEMKTVLALTYFLEEKVDFAVIETGLGGRLDCTNVIEKELAVITRIEKEHTDILGDEIEGIIDEKLGIIRAGKPVVIAPQSSEVEAIIRSKLNEVLDVYYAADEREENQATALLALETLLGSVDMRLFEEVAEKFFLPGRFDSRLIEGKEVLFDMAHTEASVARLMEKLGSEFPDREFVFLLSILKGKNVSGILDMIASKSDKIFLSSVASPRALSPEELKGFLPVFDGEVILSSDPQMLFKKALSELKREQVLVVTGSHFLLSELMNS